MVPLLAGLLKLPQHRAHGTSLAIVIFVGSAGLIGYWINKNVNWNLALYIAIGASLGAYAGAMTMTRLAPWSLRLVFGLFLLTAAVRMFFA